MTLRIDGNEVAVPAGASVLDACNAAGVDTPTLIVRNTEQDGVYESLRSCYRWLRADAQFR